MDEGDLMRKLFVTSLVLATLAFGGAAFAQSQQGGYLGENPGGHAATGSGIPPQVGSMQGGYLGKNPGATSQPQRPAGTVDANSAPTAFCDNGSIEPDRCRGRADVDHKMCADKGDQYAACRRTLDMMGWRL